LSLEDRLYPLLATYDRLPDEAKRTLGRAYRALPVRVRSGARFDEFRRLANGAYQESAEACREYQLRELRRVLVHAQAHCPFYAQAFAEAGFRPAAVDDLDGLALCPTLSKRQLADNLAGLTATSVGPKERLYMTTGGSTGVPVGFYLQKGVSRPKEKAFLESQWMRGGYFDGARLAVLRGYQTSRRSDGRIATYDATRDWLMLSSYHLSMERLGEYLDAVGRFKPDLLHAYPSAALQLADLLERAGRRWPVPLKGLLAGSEQLTLPQKRLLEATFGCPVYRWYGHAERVILAGEGSDSELFYFHPFYGFVEFGPPDGQGLCEVIGTSFHNLALPLIRYRTGDFVRPAKPVQYPWPAVSEIAGREHEFLVSRTGRRISLTAFNMHTEVFDDLYALQFAQDQPGVVELRYVASARFPPARLRVVEQAVHDKLGEDFDITLRRVEATERTAGGKHRWLVSQVPDDPPPP